MDAGVFAQKLDVLLADGGEHYDSYIGRRGSVQNSHIVT